MEFLNELFAFLVQRRKFWLIPAVVTLVLMAGLLILASGSVLAPFIYSVF